MEFLPERTLKAVHDTHSVHVLNAFSVCHAWQQESRSTMDSIKDASVTYMIAWHRLLCHLDQSHDTRDTCLWWTELVCTLSHNVHPGVDVAKQAGATCMPLLHRTHPMCPAPQTYQAQDNPEFTCFPGYQVHALL